MLLYIVRHGEPDYKTDTLTERGRLQAEAVGKRMVDAGIDRIFSSPMGRARETAAPACRMLGLDCGIEEWTHELGAERRTDFLKQNKRRSISVIPNYMFREYGGLDLPFARAFEMPMLADTQMEREQKRIAACGNEFLERLGYREENGIYRILQPNEERVALFCHTVFARTWLSALLHIPLNMMWASFVYTHTGVTILEFKNYKEGFTAPRCYCYSDMSHLYAAGLDMTYDNDFEV